MRYQRTIASPNSEDYLYLFYNPESGTYVQLRYNLIRQTVDAPLICTDRRFSRAEKWFAFMIRMTRRSIMRFKFGKPVYWPRLRCR